MAAVVQELRDVAEQVVLDRRHLHAHPELRYEEHATAAYVAERLRMHGLEVRTGVAGTGVVGVLRGGRPGKTVLLRADMDALPIDEVSDVPYRSRNAGVMHACGHDGHTAILLGAARVLSERRRQIAGNVLFVFQPAEEGGAGALKMIEQGVLDEPPVDAVFGLHVWPSRPVGTVEVGAGAIMAAADRFTINVQGKGGHAAFPHDCIDATLIAANITVALNQIVSREVRPTDPAVVTVAYSHSGSAAGRNVIADTAELGGTVRTFDSDLRQRLARRVQEVAVGVARTMGGDATVDYSFGYPASVNDVAMSELVAEATGEVVGADHVLPAEAVMGAEDFSYFLERKPGSFFRLGVGNEAKGIVHGLHHPRFDLDEAALPVGIDVMVRVAERFLSR